MGDLLTAAIGETLAAGVAIGASGGAVDPEGSASLPAIRDSLARIRAVVEAAESIGPMRTVDGYLATKDALRRLTADDRRLLGMG